MWILKLIVVIFCVAFSILGVIWIIPAMIMWDHKPVDAYYQGVWDTYDKFFNNI